MKQKPIRLTFSCQENYGEMDPTARGRFCQSCKREVIDFTRMSNPEIRDHLRSASGKVCGRVTSTQLDPDIICEIKTPDWLWKLAATIGIGVATSVGVPASAQTYTVIKPTITFSDSLQQEQWEQEQALQKALEDREQERYQQPEDHEEGNPFLETRWKNYFLTRKFPFVKKEYKVRHLMGDILVDPDFH